MEKYDIKKKQSYITFFTIFSFCYFAVFFLYNIILSIMAWGEGRIFFVLKLISILTILIIWVTLTYYVYKHHRKASLIAIMIFDVFLLAPGFFVLSGIGIMPLRILLMLHIIFSAVGLGYIRGDAVKKIQQETKIRKNIQLNYGGFRIRFAAKVIDWMVLLILLLPVYLITYLITGSAFPEDSVPITLKVYGLLWFGVFIMYDIYFIKKYNATPGKMVMKLRVKKVDGSEISWGNSILRWFIYKIGSSLWVLFLGALWIIWDEKRQGWHDKAADTIAVRE